MEKFRIYIKSDKFVWTRSRIILSVLISTLLAFGLEDLIFKEIQDNFINKIIMILMILSFGLGIINNFLKEELKGSLSGHIIFFNDKIQIANKTYLLTDIRLIKFEGYDYKDRIILSNFPSGMFSSGVDNTLIIILNSGQKVLTNFQRNSINDMRRIRKQAAIYMNQGKLIKQNYIDLISAEIF